MEWALGGAAGAASQVQNGRWAAAHTLRRGSGLGGQASRPRNRDGTWAMVIDSFFGVPIDSSGAFAGCERMPAALRAAGLASALGVTDLGNLQVALADPVRDAVSGIISLTSVIAATDVIRSATRMLLSEGRRPLLVGGCCSLLIGVAAALHDVSPGTGLAFVDGHLDCYTGRSSPTGEIADMELAVILGIGPAGLTGLTGGQRLLEPTAIMHLGARDQREAAGYGAPDPAVCAPEMLQISSEQVVLLGPAATGATAAARLGALPGFWVHLDLDVLSTAAMPAVDYPQPGGLDTDQLQELLRPLTTARGFRGMDVTILNPTRDTGGMSARRAVQLLVGVLA
jgi:arginase